MMNPPTEPPAASPIRDLLMRAYPGTGSAIVRMREQMMAFVTSPTARRVYLAGPSGVGKSTVARYLAYLKAYGISDGKLDQLQYKNVRFIGPNLIDPRIMDHYIELPLTGLVESIAESQLFGVAKGAYTGAVERDGVFDLAVKDKSSEAVRITRGVVFLDEVGDLSEKLQAKLLPVLSNGVFYRVGGEGSREHMREYRGSVISASWKRLPQVLRPDLVARLTAHVIDVPGLNERGEDLPQLVHEVAKLAINEFKVEIARLQSLEKVEIARGHLEDIGAAVMVPHETCIKRLCEVDWAMHGQLRGLANAIEKIVIQRRDPEEVIGTLPRVDHEQRKPRLADALLSWASGPVASLSDAVNDFEGLARDELNRRVAEDRAYAAALADRLGLSESDIKRHARQLARNRRSR